MSAIRRKAGGMGSLLRSQGSSLAGHRSLRSSAGANLALPAWLRFLGGASLDLLAIWFLELCLEGGSCSCCFEDLLEGRVIERAGLRRQGGEACCDTRK